MPAPRETVTAPWASSARRAGSPSRTPGHLHEPERLQHSARDFYTFGAPKGLSAESKSYHRKKGNRDREQASSPKAVGSTQLTPDPSQLFSWSSWCL